MEPTPISYQIPKSIDSHQFQPGWNSPFADKFHLTQQQQQSFRY